MSLDSIFGNFEDLTGTFTVADVAMALVVFKNASPEYVILITNLVHHITKPLTIKKFT